MEAKQKEPNKWTKNERGQNTATVLNLVTDYTIHMWLTRAAKVNFDIFLIREFAAAPPSLCHPSKGNA